jgi:Flp pilus assembly protein TadB
MLAGIVAATVAATVAAIWLVTLLPVLLVVGLVAALLLIPVLRELRAELERMERVQQGPPPPLQDVTPWHRKAWNRWRER